MPRYEFPCEKCQKPFELTMTISERAKACIPPRIRWRTRASRGTVRPRPGSAGAGGAGWRPNGAGPAYPSGGHVLLLPVNSFRQATSG